VKASEFRELTEDDLVKKEKELVEELGNLAFQHRLRPLEDTSLLKKLRKDIARLRTITREKTNESPAQETGA
jgi:large subunit ribosomal protein L29